MEIKCPCCGDCFAPNEDFLRWNYSEEINYNDSTKFVWENIPLLRSTWGCNNDDTVVEINSDKNSVENHN